MSDEATPEEVWMRIPGFPDYEIKENMQLRRVVDKTLVNPIVGGGDLIRYFVKHANGSKHEIHAVELRHMAEVEAEEEARVAAKIQPRTLEDNHRDRVELDEVYWRRRQELLDENKRLREEVGQ